MIPTKGFLPLCLRSSQTPPRRRRDTLLELRPRRGLKLTTRFLLKMTMCLEVLPHPRAPTQLATVPPQVQMAQTLRRSLLTRPLLVAVAPLDQTVVRAGLRSQRRRRTTTIVLRAFRDPSGRLGSFGHLGEAVDLLMMMVAVVEAGVVEVVAAVVMVPSGLPLATPIGSVSM